ncbi:MAG: putative H(+)/Cl(-) exchange transporter ClcA [Planctomycetaceae bacterium]|nr:putative H(+)/Cl(-) exchange transporter ClcA [Planctomycetaceae bacterium]
MEDHEPATSSPDDSHHAGASVIERGEKLNQARRRLFPHALCVGLLTGVLAVAFRVCLDRGEEWRSHFLAWAATAGGLGIASLVVMACLVVGVSLWLIKAICPEASGSGIPHLRLVLSERGRLNWRRVIPVKFVSGWLAIAGGLCLGREGPTIQMGASLGAMWGESHLGKSADRRTLVVTGASAGLATAFNAPMAGILFSIEELHINLPESAFFAAMISCISSDLLARSILGQTPVLQATINQIPPLESLPFFIVLGILCGCLAWLFNHSLVFTTRHLTFQSFQPNLTKVLIAGSTLAMVGWYYPPLLGGGIDLSNRALTGEGTIAWLSAMLVLRFLMSIGSYAVGTAGGIFAPLLVLGGLLGLLTGEISQHLFPTAVPEPTAFAVVGMAAVFASVVRCPLTGIVLIIEMTGHYALILPLMVASFTAAITADELHVAPVYDALLESQLATTATPEAITESAGTR